MKKCSPVEMRKNLEAVNHLMRAGINFVAIPAKDQGHKNELIAQCNEVLTEMVKESELDINNN